SARRAALRRAAADAGHRPGADGPAEALAVGRAVPGAGPAGGGANLRRDPRPEPPGDVGAARRAERPDGAEGGPPRVRAGDGPDHLCRPGRRAAQRPPGPGGVSWGIKPTDGRPWAFDADHEDHPRRNGPAERPAAAARVAARVAGPAGRE